MGRADGQVVRAELVVDHGPAPDRWNLVLLAEGYAADELRQFESDSTAFSSKLLATPPFDRVAAAINVFRIVVISAESGADNPADGIERRTFFDATFGAFGISRLLVVDSVLAQEVARSIVPEMHAAVVIVNHGQYGGSGGDVAVCSTDSAAADIGLHELGHSAFGLADEYDYLVGCGETTDPQHPRVEPVAANATIRRERAELKWAALIDPATSIPTLANATCTRCTDTPSPVADGTVGLFEGAAWFPCGVFRGMYTCKMNADLTAPFCAVCQARIVATLDMFLPSAVESAT